MATLLQNVSKCTKRDAAANKIMSAEWTIDGQQAWARVTHLVGGMRHSGATMCRVYGYGIYRYLRPSLGSHSHARSGRQSVVWRPSPGMQHAPLAFVSRSFTNSNLRWATLVKEAFALVGTVRRLEWLLCSGPVICTDHRNLMYILNLQTAVSNLSKVTSQGLNELGYIPWKLKYSIGHIDGKWGDLLSRRISAPVSTRSLAVRAPLPEAPNMDGETGRNANSPPSVDAFQGVQRMLPHRRTMAPAFQALSSWTTGAWPAEQTAGSIQCPSQERCGFRRVPNISNCAYWPARTVGRPGIAIRASSWPSCLLHVAGREWKRTWVRISNVCPNCVDSRGRGKIPRPVGVTTHGTEVNSCLHLYHIFIRSGILKIHQLAQTQADTGSTAGDRQSDGEHGIRAGGTRAESKPLR